jgi:thermostable 8-oxoguanine DNA glycosylase
MTLERFLELYREIRRRVDANTAGSQMRQSVEGITRPTNADDLAGILVQVILSSGFSYRNAMRIWDKIEPQMDTDQPLTDVSHLLKRSAIEIIRRDRQALFASFQKIRTPEEGFQWCERIPFIQGPALKCQAMRDLGVADVAKPDRHLVRIARLVNNFNHRSDELAVQELCRQVSQRTGDSVGVVDIVIWYAASENLIDGIGRCGLA